VNTAERGLIEHHWRELESEWASEERKVRVADLPIDTAYGPPAVAVDYDGHRHVLVPVNSHQRVRRGLDGPVLQLRRRSLEDEQVYQTYADLGCLQSDFHDLFTMLCAEVLQTIGPLSENPIKALYRVLDRWRALFQIKGTPLGPEQIAGLFAELTVLIRLLRQDPSAQTLWRGPSGHRHDFTADAAAVEVKASVSREGRRARIHGLSQLETPPAGTLRLAWYRLERDSGSGQSLVELVEHALDLCDDERALLGLLAEAGYRSSDNDHYRDARFSITEERWYVVDAAFPKLTGNDLATAAIPTAVLDVAYTIDLSSEPPNPMGQDQVSEYLAAMIRAST
jgi:hypothetical protein